MKSLAIRKSQAIGSCLATFLLLLVNAGCIPSPNTPLGGPPPQANKTGIASATTNSAITPLGGSTPVEPLILSRAAEPEIAPIPRKEVRQERLANNASTTVVTAKPDETFLPASTARSIPIADFFAAPTITSVTISPDGKSIAYLQHVSRVDGFGHWQLMVSDVGDFSQAKPWPIEGNHDVISYSWAFTSRQIIYLQDLNGNGENHVSCANLDTGETRDLTPNAGNSASVLAISRKFPAEILLGIKDDSSQTTYDVYRINIVTAAHKLLRKNDRFARFYVDDNYRLRLAELERSDGSREFYQPNAEERFEPFIKCGPIDAAATMVLGFDKSAQRIFLLDSRDRDLAALVSIEMETGQVTPIAASPVAEITGVLIHPSEHEVEAVTVRDSRQKWTIIDDRVDADLEYLHQQIDGELDIVSRTVDDTMWIVRSRSDQGPSDYYVYSRQPRGLQRLCSDNPTLAALPLVKMQSAKIRTTDGLDLTTYLSVPNHSDTDQDGLPDRPLPLVLIVHGGPWVRDVWGYHPLHQFLANRGYAALSVNYRGSEGYGRQFVDAGDRQWARSVQDDLATAVDWAIRSRIAEPGQVAILGGGFGGHLALTAMTRSPNPFCCAIAISAPMDLAGWLKRPPPDWRSMQSQLPQRIGDINDAADRERLVNESPTKNASRINAPILVAHGARDPYVLAEEVDQFVGRLRDRGVNVEYQIYPDEGHGLRDPQNRLGFYQAMERFLKAHLEDGRDDR